MLEVGSLKDWTCAGVRRRSVLQLGAAGALGLSMARPGVAASGEMSVLCIFLRGGVSHLDTWDMKPDAPIPDARGEFKPIPTNVPGLQFCDLLPLLAKQADKLTVLRGATHREGEHDRAMQWMLTGQPAQAGRVFPNFGSVIGRYKPGHTPIPAALHVQAVGIGNPMAPPAPADYPGVGAGFMGASHQPFLVPDPEKLSEVDWLKPAEIIPARLDRRRDLLHQLDGFQARSETAGLENHSVAYRRAMAVITSPEAKQAFSLDSEKAALRDRYGRHEFGQSCLLGRRLIETGVRYVQVNWSARGWEAITKKDDLFTRSTFDSHFGHFPWLRRQLPRLDQGLSTLLADLADRGTLKRTLVVVLTDFGRSAKVNGDGGRDHWTNAFTVLMAGGGLEGGRILGNTDANGQEVTDGRFTPDQLVNSVYGLCGLDVPVTLRIAGIVPQGAEGIPGLI